jgi:hypothetical protein
VWPLVPDIAALYAGVIAAVFVALQALPTLPALALGVLATALSAYGCLRALVRLTAPERLPRTIRRLLRLGAET